MYTLKEAVLTKKVLIQLIMIAGHKYLYCRFHLELTWGACQCDLFSNLPEQITYTTQVLCTRTLVSWMCQYFTNKRHATFKTQCLYYTRAHSTQNQYCMVTPSLCSVSSIHHYTGQRTVTLQIVMYTLTVERTVLPSFLQIIHAFDPYPATS